MYKIYSNILPYQLTCFMPSVSRPEYRCSGNIIVEVGGIKGEECGISVAIGGLNCWLRNECSKTIQVMVTFNDSEIGEYLFIFVKYFA